MHLSMLTPRGGGVLYVGYLIINCIPTLGILISILAPSWGNLNRMTFINIVFIAIYCKMVWHLTNIYCLTVGHLIENLLKKSNAPPMPNPPPPLGLNIDRCITNEVNLPVPPLLIFFLPTCALRSKPAVSTIVITHHIIH